jgi:hypothetical protein
VRLALLDRPAGLEGRSAQLYQLLLGEGVESVALLPELVELSAHLVEGAVPVAGTELQLLPPADKIHECRTTETNAKTTRARKKATG